MDEERLRKLAELPDLTPDDIRGLRYNVKLTQEELANKLDVSTTSVRSWEKGEASPLPPVKEKIFDSFDREDISPPPDEWNGIMYTTDILETDILEAIELCANEIGHTPTITEYEEWRANTSEDYPCNTTARSHFNGWREAVSEAGLDYPHGYTKEELVEAIELCTDEIGHTPTTTEYEEWRANTSDDYPSANTISRRISRSAKEALSEVGFDHQRGYTQEELIEAIKSCADEIGHAPTTTEYEEWRANSSDDYPGTSAICTNIKGSWKGAVSKAGFDKY